MRTSAPLLAIFGLAMGLQAHPMGNFSVNHYARIEPGPQGVNITYVIDLAEIPAFELLQRWGLEGNSPLTSLRQKAREEVAGWAQNLVLTVEGSRVPAELRDADIVVQEGAGAMPVLRITSLLFVPAHSGKFAYEDDNFPGRTGWKEVVVDAGRGASILSSTQGREDRSLGLTAYPADPALAPPQDLKTAVEWEVTAPAERLHSSTDARYKVAAMSAAVQTGAADRGKPTTATAAVPPRSVAPRPFAPGQQVAGTVVKGDFLSRLLHRKEIGLGMILAALLVAFGLGAMHALSPGHGKTIVAAYLVGSRGAIRHALFLGGVVTFTHTASVFLLGLGVLFFQQSFVTERVFPVLSAISGLSIVAVGIALFFQRIKSLKHRHGGEHHAHGHDHDHSHALSHDHLHGHTRDEGHHHHTHDGHDHLHTHQDVHGHDHHHGHTHSHGAHTHSHLPEEKITLGSLIALGVSGGLVPCPSALVLLLSAIALGRVGLGLLLLVGFSAGLALVLMGIGVLVLYAKHLLPQATGARHPAFRLVPVFSSVVVICLGLLMFSAALGWIRPGNWI